jgi:DNA-binding NarL/FixJ family response regulator
VSLTEHDMASPPSRPTTRVLVVDDHPLIRAGIRQMISADGAIAICAEAESAEEALRLAQSNNPDLAIVDLALESGNGLDLTRALREAVPDMRVLVLSMHDENLFAERALRAGAHGYIMKREAIEGLINAIREVMAGRLFVSREMSQRLIERAGRMGPSLADPINSLTDRELEVLQLIGQGLNTADIADRLALSGKTIETYRSNIKTKLNLKDATELIRYAAAWTEAL